jgi:nicotinamidase-related amidase
LNRDNAAEVILDPAKTALLLVHWQKEIADPKGRNSEDMPGRLLAKGIIERTQSVLEASRKSGMLVVYINGVHKPGYPELGARSVPLAKMLIERGVMLQGSWGVEVIDQLKPGDGDIVIENYSSSSFCYTPLDLLLRNRGITSIVLSGIATHVAIESTARDGFNMGYTVYTLEDCCLATSEEIHDWTIKNILSLIGFVTDAESYIAAING